ncbi:MAG: hypothetical protein WBQ44_20580 [Rhodococcus sp. (in: high G+C Gram-positive bacteria)]
MKTIGIPVFAAAMGAALLLAGCSSGDEANHEDHSSASAASSASSSESPTETALAAPTTNELTASLELLVAPDVDAATKVAEVENGSARLINFETMTAALANYGEITFEVGEPVVEGQTTTAPVTIATPRGTTAPTPNTWVLIDGDWKVSEASACQLLAMGQAPCV